MAFHESLPEFYNHSLLVSICYIIRLMKKINPKIVLVIFVLVVLATLVQIMIQKTKTESTMKTPYDGVAVTNSWYTSIFFDQYSKVIFAYPASYKLDGSGIEISRTVPNFSNISIIMPHDPDLRIRTSNGDKFTEKRVEKIGEWDIEVSLATSSGKKLYVHIIKGSPTIYIKSDIDLSLVSVGGNINKTDDKFVVIKTARNTYLIGADSPEIVNNTLILSSKPQFTPITILPDDPISDTFSKIYNCSLNQPTKTNYKFSFNSQSQMNVDYFFSTDIIKKDYLYTVWPHQESSGSVNENLNVLGSYKTPRGELKLVCANSFSSSFAISDLPLNWESQFDNTKISSGESKRLFDQDKKELLSTTTPQGVYYKGKYAKNMVDLWELADILGLESDSADLKSKIENILVGELDNFYYDDSRNTVISKNPEFGNETGNDHHFQYSYYIYSYAKFFDSFTPDDQSRVKKLLAMFQKEGIPLDRKIYPTSLRFLDVMESHSWADGQGLFNDGNNQESSSEATFYWYSWYIWGRKVSNNKLSDWAKFAFFSEVNGKMAYWFLVNNEALSDNFKKPILSLIWGGKADYATWFSPEDDKIFGIQLLPLNPSSLISLKIPDSQALNRIIDYYDGILPEMRRTNNSFANLYLAFKKINGVPLNPNDLQPNGEYVSRTLIYLMK